ncbi:hypothetical protein [Williamsia herbipolensis]|uniref:hypothetical protein n=1 Tax=Williamsia herbipolensis TaxID=1603258 RepID=UPI0012379546|nr:hypothetical protein [Williamsia herbipolensis]
MARRRFEQIVRKSPYLWTFALTVLAGLASLPIVISSYGSETWAAIALGQAVGTFGAVCVSFGYGAFGPSYVASADPALRPALYVDSLIIRAPILVLSTALCSAAAWILAPSAPAVGVCASVAGLLFGMNGNWFFIGSARPVAMFMTDAVPRLSGVVVGLSIAMAGGQVAFFVGAQLLGSFLSIPASAAVAIGRNKVSQRKIRTLSDYWDALRNQSSGFLLAGTASLYVSLPVALVALVAPNSLPAYALGDKLVRFATAGLTIVTQVLQGWVPASRSMDELVARSARSARAIAVWAVLVGVLFCALAKFVGVSLSHGQIALPWALVVPMAVSLSCIVVSQFFGLVVLPAFNKQSVAVASTVIGAVVATATAVVAVSVFRQGYTVAISVAAAEVCVLLYQYLKVRPLLNVPVCSKWSTEVRSGE